VVNTAHCCACVSLCLLNAVIHIAHLLNSCVRDLRCLLHPPPIAQIFRWKHAHPEAAESEEPALSSLVFVLEFQFVFVRALVRFVVAVVATWFSRLLLVCCDLICCFLKLSGGKEIVVVWKQRL
jgi:hypothetical protein